MSTKSEVQALTFTNPTHINGVSSVGTNTISRRADLQLHLDDSLPQFVCATAIGARAGVYLIPLANVKFVELFDPSKHSPKTAVVPAPRPAPVQPPDDTAKYDKHGNLQKRA